MDFLIYAFGRLFVALVQALPLTLVAATGRRLGGLAFFLTARYRRVALKNLTMVFGREKSPVEIRELARENFRRIGENYLSAIKTIAMSEEQMAGHIEYVGGDRFPPPPPGARPPNVVMAIGHFGNFELFARVQKVRPQYQCATTYRALKQPGFNRLLETVRRRTGVLFFERRTDGPLLRAAFARGGLILGLSADQSSKGMRAPFLGHDCDTGLSPAVFALRYRTGLYTGFCFRTGLAKWRLELGDSIPTHENGRPRSSEDIMRDVNRAYEQAILRDPANWFWVHRRWKPPAGKPKVEEQKLEDGG